MKKFLILVTILILNGITISAADTEYTVSGDMNPEIIGSIDLSDTFEYIHSLTVNGDYLWISGQSGRAKEKTNTICILDVSDSTDPKVIHKQEFEERQYIECFYGNYQYRLIPGRDPNMKLEIVDISDIENPQSVRLMDNFDGIFGKAVIAEDNLVVAAYKGGGMGSVGISTTKVYLFSLENPSGPQLICETITDISSDQEYPSIQSYIQGLETRGNLVYLVGWDSIYILGINDGKLYVIQEQKSQFDFISGITVVEETMTPRNVYQYQAGNLGVAMHFPWKVEPESGRYEMNTGVEIVRQSTVDPFTQQLGFHAGGGWTYRIPMHHIASIQSNRTLAYVTGVRMISGETEKDMINDSKMLVLDLGKSTEPEIIGECKFDNIPREATQSGDISYIIDHKNMLHVVKLPISGKEFDNIHYADVTMPGQWNPFNPPDVIPKGIEDMLRKEIGKKTGELATKDFKDIKVLELYSASLTSLDGVELCSNLEELKLGWNFIEDLTPLADLKNLKILSLERCRITNLEPLSELKNLKSLNLASNKFTDITPLAELKKLEELDISDNWGYDLNPISQMTGLKNLNIHRTGHTDLSPLKALGSLEELNIGSNHIQNIQLLENLKKLEILDIGFNYIEDFSVLSSLENLKDLKIRKQKIQDISFLKGVKSLTKLELRDNRISDLSPLSNLTNLEDLNLRTNKVRAVSGLKDLKNLKILHLGENEIVDISPLGNLTTLEKLSLNENKLTDVRALGKLVNLSERLNLQNNEITSLDGLESLSKLELLQVDRNDLVDIGAVSGMKNLITLTIYRNKLVDLTPLEKLENLESLFVRENQIVDISPIAQIKNLKRVDLSMNLITDINPIVNNKWEYDDLVLTINDNPLSDESSSKWIPRLVKSGAIIAPNAIENRCVLQLIGISEGAHAFKARSLEDKYGLLQDIKNESKLSPKTDETNLIPEYTIVRWDVTPPKTKADGSIVDSKLTVIAVPTPGKDNRIFAITDEMIVMEWMGKYIPDDFSSVSMEDEKLWRYWPAEFYSGSSEICYGGR